MYLVCKIRSDIDFTIAQLRKYNTNPKKSYLRAAKRVIRYLKRTMQIKLIYRQKSNLPRDPLSFGFKSYANSNFASDFEDHKSVIGHYFFLNDAVVSWSSKKQKTLSTSITKAEYVALDYGAKKVI